MVLPFYLAMTPEEMSVEDVLPARLSYLGCTFSPDSRGLSGAPDQLQPNAMLILTDQVPCQSHSVHSVVGMLRDIISKFQCESVLLDFQRPPSSEALAMATAIISSLPCPVGAPPDYALEKSPVFLPPCPLSRPPEDYLAPWDSREVWLESTLSQEEISVTADGTVFSSRFPPEYLDGGFYDTALCCRYTVSVFTDHVQFTLFDTVDTLRVKLKKVHSLGITRAVGLWQQFSKRKPPC